MAAATAQDKAQDAEPAPAEDVHGLPLDEDVSRQLAVAHGNSLLAQRTAAERIEWALENLPGEHVLTSSFGAQAAVSLHLVTRLRPDIPVIFIDTGYHFPETYQFVDALAERLRLTLRVYRNRLSPAWQEARHGQRWNQGLEGLSAYNRDNKVEPMERALQELRVGTWFAGLRRSQSSTRAEVPFITWAGGGRCKVHPIADWTDRDIHAYLRKHRLPYHPLWEKGYISIGDVHSTRAVHEVEHADQTRFFGLTRECGLHQIDLSSG
jgi:phosphoadenosine phosphosulfate reductase